MISLGLLSPRSRVSRKQTSETRGATKASHCCRGVFACRQQAQHSSHDNDIGKGRKRRGRRETQALDEKLEHCVGGRRSALAPAVITGVLCQLDLLLRGTPQARGVGIGGMQKKISDDGNNKNSSNNTAEQLRDLQERFEAALNANSVVEEEASWTSIIEKYGGDQAPWAQDAVGRAYGNRGNSRSRQGNFEAAIADFGKSIDLCPYSVDPVLNRGVAYEGLGKLELAVADYRNVLQRDPKDPAAWNNLGNVNAKMENWDVSANAFKKAIELSNQFSFARLSYATILLQKGEDQEAIRELRKILLKYPSFTDARAALAVALWLTGEKTDAETQWYRVEDSRYRNITWLRESRHWPPRLVEGMEEFRTIRDV